MITFALVILATAVIGAPVDDSKLKFVTFVHRHGDRSPIGTYPSDPYANVSIWNNGWGQLTNTGKQNSYKLGKWLRERYNDFLPKIYNNDDYRVESTDVSRTLMSAYLVLAGLYEPTGNDIWNPDIKWQPIPVHTTPRNLDNVLAASKPCLRHEQLLSELMSKEIKNQINPQVVLEVLQLAGYNKSDNIMENYIRAVMVSDSLFVQNSNGMKLPKWAPQYFPSPLMEMSSLYLRAPTYNKQLQRLSCGNLVNNILRNFKQKSSGSLKTKMWHYSAHDITIVGLRQCLGFEETDTPPYASALILELRSRGKEDFVRILYKTNDTLRTMTMPGCVEDCPLRAFEDLVSPIIPQDWEAECMPVTQILT